MSDIEADACIGESVIAVVIAVMDNAITRSFCANTSRPDRHRARRWQKAILAGLAQYIFLENRDNKIYRSLLFDSNTSGTESAGCNFYTWAFT